MKKLYLYLFVACVTVAVVLGGFGEIGEAWGQRECPYGTVVLQYDVEYSNTDIRSTNLNLLSGDAKCVDVNIGIEYPVNPDRSISFWNVHLYIGLKSNFSNDYFLTRYDTRLDLVDASGNCPYTSSVVCQSQQLHLLPRPRPKVYQNRAGNLYIRESLGRPVERDFIDALTQVYLQIYSSNFEHNPRVQNLKYGDFQSGTTWGKRLTIYLEFEEKKNYVSIFNLRDSLRDETNRANSCNERLEELENNTPEPAIIRSPDFDNDGTVGFSDFVAFAQCFGKSGLEILTCFLTEND